MTDPKTNEAPVVKAKEPAAPKAPKYPLDAKIVMLADQEGKAYSADNNPKRAGSKSADRFASYGSGVTVTAFLAAGGTTADIDNDIKKAFIKVEAAS